MLREARVEAGLQDLQERLLDESVEHRRNAELAHPAAALRYLLSSHRLRAGTSPRAAASRIRVPVLSTGTAAVPPSSSRRCRDCPCSSSLASAPPSGSGATAPVPSGRAPWVSAPLRRRRGFHAPSFARGFTPAHERELQLPGLLWHGPFEAQARFTLLHVRPFAAASPAATTASADSSLRRSSRRRPFRREARSPQVRTRPFAARPPDLRRLGLGHRGFAGPRPLAPPGVASYPVPVRRPAVSLPASSPRSVALPQLRFASFAMACSREDFHLLGRAHAGRTDRP